MPVLNAPTTYLLEPTDGSGAQVRPGLLRQSELALMRWTDDNTGVLGFSHPVLWRQEVRARNELRARAGDKPTRAMSAFAPGPHMQAISDATSIAAETARAYRVLHEWHIVVVAELWECPLVGGPMGTLRELPTGWYVEDDKVRNAWLLKASQGKRTIRGGKRARPVLVTSADVWNSIMPLAHNQASLDGFAAALAGHSGLGTQVSSSAQ